MRAKLIFQSCLFAVAVSFMASVPQSARAQASNILDFFSQELDLPGSGDDNGEADQNGDAQGQEAESTSTAGSISDFFGDVPALAPNAQQAVQATQGQAAQVPLEYDPQKVEQDLRNDAYNQALQGLLPLKPDQIRRLLEEFDRTQESYELPVYPLPKPELTVQTLSLDPGTKPLTIRAAQGHVTTLNMLDVTGAPWPIEDITWAGNFNIIKAAEGDEGIHFIRITPQSEFAYGNMSIKMVGLKTPIIMTIETSRDLVHYRFDAIVPDYGPFAEAPLIEGGVSLTAGNAAMSSVLQGVIPSGAKRMSVNGTDSRTSVSRYSGKMYVRTPLTLLSPSWSSSVASADGMRVYTINEAPVLLLSNKGKMLRVNVRPQEEAAP